jgi:hypothetical protein
MANIKVGDFVRHTIELLLCSAIGGYCLWRCIAVMPAAYDEVMAVISAAFGRVRDIEAAIDEAAE